MRASLPIALCTAATFLVSSGASAQTTPPPVIVTGTPTSSVAGSQAGRSATVTPTTHKSVWQSDGSWGWFVVASSIFVGTGLTGFGLGQTCDDPEGVNACTRGTSLALWGGIGIAALGSAIGLLIVQEGRVKTHGHNIGTIKLGPLGEFRLAPPPYAMPRDF